MSSLINSEPAHSVFGGSVAGRVLRCPRSVQLIEKVPAYLRKISVYADRGSACHLAVTRLLDGHSFAGVAGTTFNGYALTADDIAYSVRPVFAWVDALLDSPSAEYFVECHVTFPGIAGAFGTADLIARIGNAGHIVDYKFGSGVPVAAFSPADDDPDVDIVNPQLLFYAAAARYSLPDFFTGVDRIVLTILQPNSIEPDAELESSVAVTHGELDEFIVAYRAACAEARSESPRLERGTWCRFCAARPVCPAHTGPLLSLAAFEAPKLLRANGSAPPAKEKYLQAIAHGLDLLDAVKDLRVALHDQAKRALENGDVVPGYALSAGRAERRWRDDEHTAIAALETLGLARDDIVAQAMRSPNQVELRAKARGLKVPSELIVSTRSGRSLTRVENARAPVPGRGELVRSFSRALEEVLQERMERK
jgi:hypothetical protein